jgi:hypothetical protein
MIWMAFRSIILRKIGEVLSKSFDLKREILDGDILRKREVKVCEPSGGCRVSWMCVPSKFLNSHFRRLYRWPGNMNAQDALVIKEPTQQA